MNADKTDGLDEGWNPVFQSFNPKICIFWGGGFAEPKHKTQDGNIILFLPT